MTYIIQDISSKIVTTKFGPKPAYNIVANGETFGYGFKKPSVNIGDEVDFKYTENSYGKNIDVTSLQMINKGDPSATPPTPGPVISVAPAAPPRPFGPPTKVFPIPPLHGDRAIVRQNSITNATKLLSESMHTVEITDVKQEDMEKLADMIIIIARKFEAYSCGDLDLAEAMKGV